MGDGFSRASDHSLLAEPNRTRFLDPRKLVEEYSDGRPLVLLASDDEAAVETFRQAFQESRIPRGARVGLGWGGPFGRGSSFLGPLFGRFCRETKRKTESLLGGSPKNRHKGNCGRRRKVWRGGWKGALTSLGSLLS